MSYDSGGTSFRAWTLLKDYGLRGVVLDTNGISIGELSGATDEASVESAARGAVKGLVPAP